MHLIVVHHMVATIVGAEMVFHRRIGVADSHSAERRIAAQLGCLEHQFEVHHVIDNGRTHPTALALPAAVFVPRLEHSRSGAEACGERACRLHDDIGVYRVVRHGVRLPVGAINHKADVVVPFQVLNTIERKRVARGVGEVLLVARQAIEFPYRTGEETGAPVVNRNILDNAIDDRARVEDLGRVLLHKGYLVVYLLPSSGDDMVIRESSRVLRAS